jgi:hypothetical protein
VEKDRARRSVSLASGRLRSRSEPRRRTVADDLPLCWISLTQALREGSRRTAIDWAGMTKPGGRCFIGSPVKSANPNRSAVAERRPATVYAASDDCTRSGQTAISSRYPSRRCCPGATLTAKFATRRAQTQEIPSEPGTSCILFKQLPKRGLPKPPKRNGSKGAVRPVFTYIFPSHDRAIALARDARAVIVVGLEKRVPLVLKARVEPSG